MFHIFGKTATNFANAREWLVAVYIELPVVYNSNEEKSPSGLFFSITEYHLVSPSNTE